MISNLLLLFFKHQKTLLPYKNKIMRNILLLGAFLLYSVFSFGQIERSIFSTYDLTDIQQINIRLGDNTSVKIWPGNNILVEAHLSFFNGSKSIFENLIKSERYNLIESRSSSSITLTENPKLKRKITSTSGTTYDEIIERVIYIPEEYVLSNGAYIKAIETPVETRPPTQKITKKDSTNIQQPILDSIPPLKDTMPQKL